MALPFVLIQLLGLVSAQTTTEPSATGSADTTLSPSTITSAPSSARSSSSRAPQTFTVEVGPGDFIYKPDRLDDVKINDTVLFSFYPPDHSVARAEYGNPCVPYEYTGKDKTGFWSGVQYVDSVQHMANWSLLINDTEPIFFYCAAPGSCIDHQMVGAINPNSSQTLAFQKQKAKEAKFMVAPGEPLPAEGSASLSAPAGIATSTSAPPPVSSQPHGVHLSGGAIAGIVVGAIAFLVICAALFFFVGRTKSLKEVMKRHDATNKTTPATPRTEFSGAPSSGFPPPFSPTQNHAEYGNVPPYGQHQVSDPHPSGGWTSPTAYPGYMSMAQAQMAETKTQPMYAPAEMASPAPHQQSFTAELEAPIKTPR
ncbi:hypothetical protein EJ04DRAFT_564591 [Polyplosphaeria fusca]|uniref:Extracellular serine-rich protein n=1 Tax=Polyplosphaeria fusca TaxID=682080 RepID=A0A9P4UZA2_9PLEO|nr:hypothetical protein EJ04DRAFT_564591 [Polyplosphaeria fusca]